MTNIKRKFVGVTRKIASPQGGVEHTDNSSLNLKIYMDKISLHPFSSCLNVGK